MSRLNVASIKNSRIPASLGICVTDPRLLSWLNEAEEMMISYGRWWGAIQRAQFCVSDGCIVFPAGIENIEQIAINGTPLPIYTNWYAFTQTLASVKQCSGCSSSCSSSCSSNANPLFPCGHIYTEDHGDAVSFATTKGENKVLRFRTTNVADIGKKIIVQGYDINNIWVRTVIDSIVQDGEEITLASGPVDTVTVWYPGSPTAIIKDVTDYRVLMHSYDTSTTLEVALGEYQPYETLPNYRRFFIPQFNSIASDCCTTTCPTTKTVTALVKLAHTPLSIDNDWLIFENLNAYKAAMLAMKSQEEGFADRFLYYFFGTQASPKNFRGPFRVVNRGGAIPMLNAELRSKTGDRTDAYVHHEATNRLPYSLAGFM
jgi:hypothetical protein